MPQDNEGKVSMEEMLEELDKAHFENTFSEYNEEREEDMRYEGDLMDKDVEYEREMSEEFGL